MENEKKIYCCAGYVYFNILANNEQEVYDWLTEHSLDEIIERSQDHMESGVEVIEESVWDDVGYFEI